LGVGDACNARDVHAFVRAIASQRLQAISGIRIPQLDRLIRTAASEGTSNISSLLSFKPFLYLFFTHTKNLTNRTQEFGVLGCLIDLGENLPCH
jgi:hypothetical protein